MGQFSQSVIRRVLASMLIVAVAVVLVTAYRAANTSIALAGVVHDSSSVQMSTDLQCGAGRECGPDNPATRVAPSVPRGPKVRP